MRNKRVGKTSLNLAALNSALAFLHFILIKPLNVFVQTAQSAVFILEHLEVFPHLAILRYKQVVQSKCYVIQNSVQRERAIVNEFCFFLNWISDVCLFNLTIGFKKEFSSKEYKIEFIYQTEKKFKSNKASIGSWSNTTCWSCSANRQLVCLHISRDQ